MFENYTPQVPLPFLDAAQYFPLSAFPPELLRTAVAVQRSTQAPGELILNSLICAIAATFQAHYDVEGLNGNPIPLSQYMVAVSPSGEGKTSAQRAITKPIVDFSTQIEEVSIRAMETWHSEQAEWVRVLDGLSARKAKLLADGKDIDNIESALSAHRDQKLSKPKITRLITNDPSPAGLRTWLSNGLGCGLVQNADAGKLINGPLLQEASLLCDIWSGENITVDRGNSHITIPNPRMTVSLMTQPNFAQQLLQKNGENFRGSGLSGRFLFYMPMSRIGRRQLGAQPTNEDNHAIEAYYTKMSERLKTLYGDGQRMPTSRIVVKLSTSARGYLINLGQNIEAQMAPGGTFWYMTEFATKIIEHTCRIAALFTLYEGSEQNGVSLENAQRAAELVNYFTQQYAAIHSPYFGPARDIILANILLEFISQKTQYGMYTVPRTLIIQNAPSALRNKDQLDLALTLLIQNNRVLICQIPGKKPGYTRMAYQITNYSAIPVPRF